MTKRARAVTGLAVILVLAVLTAGCSTSLNVDIEELARAAEAELASTEESPASAPPTPTTSAASAPTPAAPASSALISECFTEDELRFVDGVSVACTEPHIAEFFAVMERSEPEGAPWPGLDVVQGQASDFCNESFGRTKGVAGQISALDILFFRPEPDTWATGDREISCFVQYPEVTSLPLTQIDPMRAFGMVSTFGLETGDCIADDSLVENVAVTLVGCEDPHWFEVFESVEMTPGQFPGPEAILGFAEEVCDTSFEAYVGVSRAESSLTVERLFPTRESWEDWSDRLVSCVIADDELRSSSVAGSGL